MIKKVTREFFLLSRGEQRGLLAVALLLFISILIRFIVGSAPVELNDESALFIEEARKLLSMAEDEEATVENHYGGKEVSRIAKQELHDFDPNRVSKSELAEMGIPSFASSNIIKYRNAGGYFNSPADLLKIYGVDTALYISLKPYLVMGDGEGDEKSYEKGDEKADGKGDEKSDGKGEIAVADIIELNRADTADLMKLPGIGPVFAERIIKYRSLLGGFTDLQQLNEVYGLESYQVSRVDSILSVDKYLIKPIDLNRATFNQLLRHPYLSKSEVQAILQYREFAVKIVSSEELIQNISMDSARWKRVSSYLITDDLNSSSEK